MWTYSKKLEYPVKIARPDAAAAKVIISQLEVQTSPRYKEAPENPVPL